MKNNIKETQDRFVMSLSIASTLRDKDKTLLQIEPEISFYKNFHNLSQSKKEERLDFILDRLKLNILNLLKDDAVEADTIIFNRPIEKVSE